MKKQVKLIVVAGLAGSGKSTIGKIISERLNYFYLDKDTLFEGMVEELLKEKGSYKGDRESSIYQQEINALEYKSLIKIALENVTLGNNVILSAPFIQQLRDDNWFSENILSKFPNNFIDLKIVWINTDEETDYYRLRKRKSIRDHHKLNNWDEYCKNVKDYRLEQNEDQVSKSFFVLDNRKSSEDFLNEEIEVLLKWLEQ